MTISTFPFIKKIAILGLVAVFGLGATGCATNNGPKQGIGTLAGAVIGGIAGAQVGSGTGRLLAVGLGALAGAAIGGDIGKSLDSADRAAMGQSTQTALETTPSGQATAWNNPDSGNYGTITPQPAYKDTSGTFCREYQQTVTVGGETETAYGTACRQADGSWKITNI